MNSNLNWLFLDLNAYFASVEQQLTPALRGIPMAVVPVMTDSTCCIAVSYEARSFGIRTGTLVSEARVLCPQMKFVEARQSIYVAFHQEIVKTVETCIPVDHVLSIDEMICQLGGSQRSVDNAIALAHKIKQAIYKQVGLYLKCSIGLAPNRLLSKVASDMQKPDGLTVLRKEELPEILYSLNIRDLPGIGGQMETRLQRAGICSLEQLSHLSNQELRRLWGGIQGERLWNGLRGNDMVEPATHRHSIGHSHLLPPVMRNLQGAYQVAKRLTSKAAVRLRKEKLWTTGLFLSFRFKDHFTWEAKARFTEAQATPCFLKVLEELWMNVPQKDPLWVGVTLCPLIVEDHHTPGLFENPRQERLSSIMDEINEKHGKDTAYFASLQDTLRQAPTRIAFTRIPDLAEF